MRSERLAKVLRARALVVFSGERGGCLEAQAKANERLIIGVV
jgi:hypothetical protein